MSKINFNAMTLDEVKRYFLGHRDDQEAFYAYMDKLHGDNRLIVIDPTDPNSETHAQSAIQQKLSPLPQTD